MTNEMNGMTNGKMNKLERRRRYWRMAVRRYNDWGESNPFDTRRRWWEEPSWKFLTLVPRLAVIWFFKRLLWLRAQIDWHVDQHNCGCYLCKHEKRKHVGNASEGKPMQELRVRRAMDAEMADYLRHELDFSPVYDG